MKIKRKTSIILAVIAILVIGIFVSPEAVSAGGPYLVKGGKDGDIKGEINCSEVKQFLGLTCGDNEWKIDNPTHTVYKKTIGDKYIEVTVTQPTLSWKSNFDICFVIVKGGTDAYVYTYTSGQHSGTGLVSPLNPGDQIPDISHFNFCYSDPGDNGDNGNGDNGNGDNGNGVNGDNGNGVDGNGEVTNGNGVIECPKCALVVLKRDETGNAIDGAVFEVDGVRKTIKDGKARWDNLECDTTYEVKEISPNDYREGIHLGDCGERSTMRVVNKIEEGELEVLGIMEVLPFTGPAIPYSPFIGISSVLAGAVLYILSKSKKKR